MGYTTHISWLAGNSLENQVYRNDDDDEEDLLVDQLEDIKMADDLLRDIETGKVRDIKDPVMISTLIGGAKAAMAVAPHIKKFMPRVNNWGSRLGWGRRRRRGRW